MMRTTMKLVVKVFFNNDMVQVEEHTIVERAMKAGPDVSQ